MKSGSSAFIASGSHWSLTSFISSCIEKSLPSIHSKLSSWSSLSSQDQHDQHYSDRLAIWFEKTWKFLFSSLSFQRWSTFLILSFILSLFERFSPFYPSEVHVTSEIKTKEKRVVWFKVQKKNKTTWFKRSNVLFFSSEFIDLR